MKASSIYLSLLLIVTLSSCENSYQKFTTAPIDYNVYLSAETNASKDLAKKELSFWENKLNDTPNQYPYLGKLASANSQLFNCTGDINYLISAEKNLIEVNDRTHYNNAAYLRALARNYISQHRFRESLQLLKKAETNGEKLQNTQKMLFDVHLELGHYSEAKSYLNKFTNRSDFDYLIRVSKWSDHRGDLEAAIRYMEKAMRIAESSNNKPLMQWSYTNLADFYGHANNIKSSYGYYLKALTLNPDDAYAKKGLAWITYSHERNTNEALRILESISKLHQSPDYFLLKAEIAEFLNNHANKEKNIKLYLEAVNKHQYGAMYNKYKVLLFSEEQNNREKAFKLAQEEIAERPTPQSYDLLAWTYLKNGDKERALGIVEQNILNNTYEPEIQYHIAEIYKANGKNDLVLKIKENLLESAYELGPVMEKQIKML